MRSAKQIGSTVSEWHESQRNERAETLRALLADLDRAHDAAWYRWIEDGCKPLTESEYEAQGGKFAKAKR